MNDKLQEAEEDKQKLKKQVLWLSYLCMTNDFPLEMIMTLFLGAEPQPESRDEQGKIHPRQ